jgi:hypothetical protein
MGPVDESGNAADAAAEPVKPEIESAAASKPADHSAAQIEVEKVGQPRYGKLADDRAPAIFTPAAHHHRFSRAAILAFAIALSAAAGSVVGAVAAVAFAKPQTPDDARTLEVNALRGVITQLSADVASLKASIDNNAKSANLQMAKIADRVERAEKAQAEPASRVAKLSELLERIDRRTAQVAAPSAAAPETTGSVAQKQQDRPAVLAGWMLREVFNGGAVVESERMGIFEVVPGANLPGLGRVETIRRQEGRWVVITPKGMIISQR